MKKFFSAFFLVSGFFVTLQAASCPEADYDGCYVDGYSIVETEPNIYWPHNQMEAAHWAGYRYRSHSQRKNISRQHHKVSSCRKHPTSRKRCKILSACR